MRNTQAMRRKTPRRDVFKYVKLLRPLVKLAPDE
jgi:hypothetical protein